MCKNRSSFLKEIKIKVSTETLNDIEKQFVSVVDQALSNVEMSKEPEELNRFRKLFKKHVPLTKRSYVAAYLARQAVIGTEKTEAHSFSHASNQSRPLHQGKPKIVLKEDEAKSLFLGVGRKRGVGPKEIITLIMQNTELPREHIGEIKILENYCFVQVKKEDADEVIESLNNFKFRGRPLSVSYATSKPEKSDTLVVDEEEKEGLQSDDVNNQSEDEVADKEL